ncbi:MAG TPA: hypothetical protein VF529_19165 [Solirubrobacteraceae bacterium]|jgi:hypothetical protein
MRQRYGGSPLHLAAHAVAFALAGWAILQLADVRRADNVLAWFVAALLLHDLVVLPFYSLIDRIAAAATPGTAVNHVRVPAAFSALLLAVWSPTILGLNDASFGRVAGFTREGVFVHWLWLTAALFAGSAAVWLLRARRSAPDRR